MVCKLNSLTLSWLRKYKQLSVDKTNENKQCFFI